MKTWCRYSPNRPCKEAALGPLCTQLAPAPINRNITEKGKLCFSFLHFPTCTHSWRPCTVPAVRVNLVLGQFWHLQRLQGVGSRSCSAPTSCVTLGKPESLSESWLSHLPWFHRITWEKAHVWYLPCMAENTRANRLAGQGHSKFMVSNFEWSLRTAGNPTLFL